MQVKDKVMVGLDMVYGRLDYTLRGSDDRQGYTTMFTYGGLSYTGYVWLEQTVSFKLWLGLAIHVIMKPYRTSA